VCLRFRTGIATKNGNWNVPVLHEAAAVQAAAAETILHAQRAVGSFRILAVARLVPKEPEGLAHRGFGFVDCR
jgi:hypothetical protein